MTATPRPWLPSRGLTTTEPPSACAACQAAAALSTELPIGTGTPAASSSILVRSLSWAIDSEIALVMSVSAAWMRRCLLPQPNCTMLPWVSRW
ncbi:Uncharacterised protein [Bordetella pertussis]|nr:Uncharacterised protein [Bordetella pertussis]